MQKFDYLILGGGVVAGYAAQELAEQKRKGANVAIISADQALPYERPPLSKAYLAGEKETQDILINDPDFYSENGIEVFLETRIGKVDLDKKKLVAANGQEFSYGKLLIATGSQVRKLDVPGADDEAVFYLRWLDNAQAIRQRATESQRAVVVGGGLIGLETAAVLAQEGVAVTMAFPEAYLMERLFTPEMGDFFHCYYSERGVTILPRSTVVGFDRRDGELVVKLKSGDSLHTDVAIVGIGAQPAVELFTDTAIKTDDGIVVNEFLETSVPDVYAAGDVVRYKDRIFDTYRRVEHWDNAMAQGIHAAQVMTGERQPFEQVPYFFSDEFDLSWEFWGDASNADTAIHRGDVAGGEFSTWWLKGERLVAAFALNRPEAEGKVAQQLIRSREPAPVDLLRNSSLALAESPVLA
jgi:NADPH-dependent 2,4-dienoyl-CoA reductase/sulfur reductase-like enzyme